MKALVGAAARRALWLFRILLEIIGGPGAMLVDLIGTGRIYEKMPHYCVDCQDTHGDGEICPRQEQGLCDICGIVDLDRYGNCSPAGDRWRYHRITRRWRTNERKRGLALVARGCTKTAR